MLGDRIDEYTWSILQEYTMDESPNLSTQAFLASSPSVSGGLRSARGMPRSL
jgi:hypothetical protein